MNCRQRWIGAALSLAVLLGATRLAVAQVDRGTITGTVVDASGGLIAGASVKAVHVATNFERTVTTSPVGTYTIPQLQVGAYVVIITGYASLDSAIQARLAGNSQGSLSLQFVARGAGTKEQKEIRNNATVTVGKATIAMRRMEQAKMT